MARYLIRLLNDKSHTPAESREMAAEFRKFLGSKEAIGHLRVSGRAIEFDLFADNAEDLNSKRALLEEKVAKVLTVKRLDQLPGPREKVDVLREGIALFNEERYWECHEVLEQIWHPSVGAERNIIQGLILTAAALVHHQKDEEDVSLSMLRKARERLGSDQEYLGVDLSRVRQEIDRVLQSRAPKPFTITVHN